MAIGTSVPPRAYTREILTTAFNWLQSQPDAVRAKATTPDALVGLFMQAQRGGSTLQQKIEQSLQTEAPVSSQAFMSDLKNLAEGLKEFDDSKSPRAPQIAAPAPVQPTRAFVNPQAEQPVRTAGFSEPSTLHTQNLNERSLQMLADVRQGMNLSSDAEALNLMIAIAYKHLKSVIA